MSAYSQRQASQKKSPSTKTNVGPGERPLYFNNKGLFSDPFLVNHLPELEQQSGKDSGGRYLNEYWNEASYEGYDEFNHVYAQMLSLWDQYSELLPEYNEAQLEERWIKPIFKLMGWTYEVQDSKTKQAKRNVPDYSLFRNEDDYLRAKKSKTDEAYFEQVLAVADAKAWKLALDGIGRSNNNPSYQIVRYMEHADVKWGILTNGRFWRLYSTRSYSKHSTFYEIDLESLLVKRDDERFKYFYNFFRRSAFESTAASQQCFLDVVFENGVYYAKDVEENLKRRVFEVVEGIAKGFIADKKVSEADLRKAYEHSLYYLFRLMFILNCESKGLLAVDKTSDYYEYSLRKIITNLKSQYDGNQTWSSQARTYGQIQSLFDLLATGDERIGVHGFGDGAFASGDRSFFENHKIQDHYLNPALVQLACDYSDDSEDLQFIDYKRLSEDHLGSLFEGLLEYHFTYAETKLGVTKSGKVEKWSDLNERQRTAVVSVIEKGEAYLASGSSERKSTGSFYTPSSIVDLICENTLQPLTEGRTNRQILDLKIVDPAMGSAHFLLGAIRFLENTILENINQEDESLSEEEGEKARWLVLHNCVFGVDINPLAVELAKFSLWIFTAKRGFPLEPLEDQFAAADSLGIEADFDFKANWKGIFKVGGFDAVVGNPPWVSYGLRDTGTLETDKKASLLSKYPGSAEYKVSLYACFLDRFSSLIRPKGRMGIIVPDSFLLGMYFSKVRETLLSRLAISKISLVNGDFWGPGVSSGFNVILIGAAEQDAGSRAASVVETQFSEGIEDLLDGGKVNGKVEQRFFLKQGRKEFRLLFKEDDMSFMNRVYEVSKSKVSDFVMFSSGLISKGKKEEIMSKSKKNSEWKKGIVSGGQVFPERIAFEGDYINFDRNQLKSGFKDARYFEPKLFVRQTSDKVICGYDHEGLLCLNNNHVGNLKEDNDPRVLFFVHLCLNSNVMSRFYALFTLETGRAMAQIDISNLDQLPIPSPDEQSLKQAAEFYKKLSVGRMAIDEYKELGDKFYGIALKKTRKVA